VQQRLFRASIARTSSPDSWARSRRRHARRWSKPESQPARNGFCRNASGRISPQRIPLRRPDHPAAERSAVASLPPAHPHFRAEPDCSRLTRTVNVHGGRSANPVRWSAPIVASRRGHRFNLSGTSQRLDRYRLQGHAVAATGAVFKLKATDCDATVSKGSLSRCAVPGLRSTAGFRHSLSPLRHAIEDWITATRSQRHRRPRRNRQIHHGAPVRPSCQGLRIARKSAGCVSPAAPRVRPAPWERCSRSAVQARDGHYAGVAKVASRRVFCTLAAGSSARVRGRLRRSHPLRPNFSSAIRLSAKVEVLLHLGTTSGRSWLSSTGSGTNPNGICVTGLPANSTGPEFSASVRIRDANPQAKSAAAVPPKPLSAYIPASHWHSAESRTTHRPQREFAFQAARMASQHGVRFVFHHESSEVTLPYSRRSERFPILRALLHRLDGSPVIGLIVVGRTHRLAGAGFPKMASSVSAGAR